MIDYDSMLSERVKKIKPSGIRKFFSIAEEMDDVISLGVGEPDFKTPWQIRKAGIDSLSKSKTWYSANAGLAELRQEICNYLSRRFNLIYDSKSQVCVTVGGSEAIDMAIRAFLNPGDEVLIPEPCFVCYSPIVEMQYGVPVPIVTRAEDAFKLTPESLSKKITEKTKLLVLPYPNNPTGAVMKRDDLEKIAEVLRGTDVMVLSDEIYGELTYNGERHVSIAELPGMYERTVVVNGFSKAYAMTGWRLGYAAGPEPIIRNMTKIHQYAIMCAPTTSQYAAIEALRNCDDSIRQMADEYNMRRRFLVDGLNNIGLQCFEPEGAFYVFPSIKSTGLCSEEFAERLLYSKRVAVVPGNAFGDSGEGFVRISYSYSLRHLAEALKRIEEFVKEL